MVFLLECFVVVYSIICFFMLIVSVLFYLLSLFFVVSLFLFAVSKSRQVADNGKA